MAPRRPVQSPTALALSPFIAVHMQCAQLPQVAPSQAVGAANKIFSGHTCCLLRESTAIGGHNHLLLQHVLAV